MAGAARDGFMATVGHLLNRRGPDKVDDADVAAAGGSPAQAAGVPLDSDLGPMASLGSVDLGAILRTCAQPLSAETLAYLRASGPPRSLLDNDGSSDSAPSSPIRSVPTGIDAAAGSAEGLSPASGADSNEQPSPVQLQLDLTSPSAEKHSSQRPPPLLGQDGGMRSTEPSWDGAGLHPLDGGDDVSPFDMLLSAPEEIAGKPVTSSRVFPTLHALWCVVLFMLAIGPVCNAVTSCWRSRSSCRTRFCR